jgi:hypothetical protein
MPAILNHYPITHAGIRKMLHPRLGVEIDNQTCVRYLRFTRPVTIDYLELPHSVYGRWIPAVPTHPAHLILSVPDEQIGDWRVLKEIDLPYDPRIAGEGLRQDMDLEEVEAFFASILKEPPLQINLGGLHTDLLRVECDREHPVWQNHGECNGSPFSVPYGILNGLIAFGNGAELDTSQFIYQPGLRRGLIEPSPPQDMLLKQTPLGIIFSSPRFSVGFSLKRPLLIHLGWDFLGKGQTTHNRLKADWVMGVGTQLCGLSGPLLRTVKQDFGAQNWRGEVSVQGNQVRYQNLKVIDHLTIDATFTVTTDGMIVELKQTCTQPVFALECEAWRFAWDLHQGMTATAGLPTCEAGRIGRVTLPFAWASDGVGCLACQEVSSSGSSWIAQVESYREAGVGTCGFSTLRPGSDQAGWLLPGETRLELKIEVDAFTPQDSGKIADEGLARHWGSVFSCFRPEHRGFSNNTASVNCHLSQVAPTDIATSTRKLNNGLDPLDLVRFTLKRALLDGGGYGYWRNLYLDSDPALLIAAGRLHKVKPNLDWLRSVEPGLREITGRILTLRNKQGLILCRDLSGNSGSYRWSCNGMDVISFGHLDAYVNALAYRGLRCAAGMFLSLSDESYAAECHQAALQIRSGYVSTFLNPETGWIAGWRSRDEKLHDYGFLWVNGPALAYGLLDPEIARGVLLRLEQARLQVGAGEGYFGLPSNLYPIATDDHLVPRLWGTPQPTFENYTDGGYYGLNAANYLRALSLYGLTEQAERLAKELEYGLAAGYFNGGLGEGTEFRTWDGLRTGYEGTLIGNFYPVYALAIERGALKPQEPEWWPVGG